MAWTGYMTIYEARYQRDHYMAKTKTLQTENDALRVELSELKQQPLCTDDPQARFKEGMEELARQVEESSANILGISADIATRLAKKIRQAEQEARP